MNRVAAVGLLALLVVSACNGSDDKVELAPTATTTPATTTAPTPTPTPAATTKPSPKPTVLALSTKGRGCTVLEESLRLFPGQDLSISNRGLHLQEVQELQSMINGAGDGTTCIPEDGDFGPVTKQAVIAFQKKNGLVVDGLVGEETWNQLNLLLSH